MVPCAINKSLEGLVYLLEPYFSLWELVISFFYNCFTFLNEINLWSWMFLFFFMLVGLYIVRLFNFGKYVSIWFFDIIWITFVVSHLGVPSWFALCFVQIISPFGSWKSWACISTICIFYGMLAFFDPIYKGNSIKS